MSKSSFVAAGDLFITRKLPEKGYEGMQELVDFVEKQDIRFVNLEVTVHDREGYPFGFSGGTWAMAMAPRPVSGGSRHPASVPCAAFSASVSSV